MGTVAYVAGDIRNSKRFRELAALLRERAGREGVKLVGGEAEDLLADRVAAIAAQLGVTPRTALGYVSQNTVSALADVVIDVLRDRGYALDDWDQAVLETGWGFHDMIAKILRVNEQPFYAAGAP